jgi:outer membrane biosynthesis protein TonB
LLLGALLAIACVLVVALPFLRQPSASDDTLADLDASERRRLELAEERDRALAALKELEFDHRTGKITDEDYRASVGPLRRRAAETLRALEPRNGSQPHAGKEHDMQIGNVVEPPSVPEPSPVPSEPPQPTPIPEPTPVPSPIPEPTPVPEPMPQPSPPAPTIDE